MAVFLMVSHVPSPNRGPERSQILETIRSPMPSDLKHLNSARLPIYRIGMFCDDHDPAAYGDRDISVPKFFGTHYTRRHRMTHTNQNCHYSCCHYSCCCCCCCCCCTCSSVSVNQPLGYSVGLNNCERLAVTRTTCSARHRLLK